MELGFYKKKVSNILSFSKIHDIYNKENENMIVMIRNSEQLQQMFKASRERKEKERKRQQLKEEADKLLKEAIRAKRNKRVAQQQAKQEKSPQKALNEATEQPSTKYYPRHMKIYNKNIVERSPREDGLYLTREELMAAEERGEGRINWEVFDRLVAEGRKQDEEILKNYTPPKKERHDNHKYTVYVYDSQLNFIAEYPSCTKCAKALGIHSRSVSYWIEQGRPQKKTGITFLNHKLTI